MPRNITVTFDDGSTHVYQNAPDDVTPEQVSARAAKDFGRAVTALDGGKKSGGVMQQVGNLAAGAVRGAGSIGATLLAPVDAAARAVGIENSIIGRTDRRRAMDEALSGLGADTGSLAYQGGKLGAEVAGTLGVGGALGNTLARVPGVAAAPNALAAIRSSGMTGGNALTRIGGGAVAGGASAGLVNPEDATTGVAIGAALPPALQAAGMAGRAVGSAFRGQAARGGSEIAKALDLKSPQEIDAAIQQLQAARELVPGSTPTAAQALQTPQAGILQRVVSDSAGGAPLRDQLAAQNAARLAALEGVAPTAPSGYAAARQDFGEAVSRYAVPQRNAARAETSALYQSVPQDEAMLYLPDLAPIRDKYFGPAVFGGRAAVDDAVSAAQRVGTMQLPAVASGSSGKNQSLLDFVKKQGGIREGGQFAGEISDLRQAGLGRVVYKNSGQSLDRMTEKAYEAGFIPQEDPALLVDLLRENGRGTFAASDDLAARFQSMADSAAGGAPGAEVRQQKVSLKDFEDLRKSIGSAQRAASMDPARAAEAKALSEMKQSLDDRINEVVRGDGAIDENLPIDWADKLSAARASKAKEVQRFGTGPQAALFRKGSDGQPVVQGGEVAAKFWGNRPGVKDDVKSLRRLIDDNPELLGQFRSMVTTEGAATQTAAGNLGARFAKWVDTSLPGLDAAFEPSQVNMLRRIADDIKRAESAGAAGMSRGSNTYQNAQNALALGLLDNPLLNAAANRIPGVNALTGPAMSWARDTAREAKARRLAELLSDSGSAANALSALSAPQAANALRFLSNPDLAQLGYRAAPVLAADR